MFLVNLFKLCFGDQGKQIERGFLQETLTRRPKYCKV